jgi:hypothetical protein
VPAGLAGILIHISYKPKQAAPEMALPFYWQTGFKGSEVLGSGVK